MRKGKAAWHRGMQFVATSGSGHAIVIDVARDQGGTDAGPSNTELLLMALCGCTGMDVVSILRKKRLQVDAFEVEAEGEVSDDFPKRLTRIEVVYRVWGEGIRAEDLERSIELSKDKYCTVSNTLKGRAEITHRYEINPDRP